MKISEVVSHQPQTGTDGAGPHPVTSSRGGQTHLSYPDLGNGAPIGDRRDVMTSRRCSIVFFFPAPCHSRG